MNDIALISTQPPLGQGDINDLIIASGDFVAHNSVNQHQRLLLITHPGDWGERPTVGVGISAFINEESPEAMLREVRLQFTRDGMRIRSLRIDNEQQLNINADYS